MSQESSPMEKAAEEVFKIIINLLIEWLKTNGVKMLKETLKK